MISVMLLGQRLEAASICLLLSRVVVVVLRNHLLVDKKR